MSQYSNPNEDIPSCVDSSPVFFTGLTKKAATIVKPAIVSLCKLCNGNIKDDIGGDLCSDCRSIPNEISEQISLSSSEEFPFKRPTSSQTSLNESSSTADTSSMSLSSNDEKTPLLSSSVLNPSGNSAYQNELIESSIKSLLNSDIKALLNSVQTPTLESGNFKAKSSWRERQEARSKTSPYSHSTPVNQSLKNKYGPPLTNGQYPIPNGSQEYHSNASPSFSPAPWTTPPFPSCHKLSREMWQLYHEHKQTDEVRSRKMHLRDTLHGILRQQFVDCALYVVGSSMTGLGANSSDIDMCLMLTDSEIDQRKEALTILQEVRKLFRKCKFLCNIQLIPATVPILKFFDSVSQVEVDLNINNAIGIRNTQLLCSYARIDGRVAPLIVLVKLWAQCHNINDAKHCSLSSYSLVLMVIHYLQYRCRPPVVPCLQTLQPDKFLPNADVRKLSPHEELPNFISENCQDLGDLFLGFLNYFANEFNFYDSVISVRLGKVIPKNIAKNNSSSPKNKVGHWKFVCIEEPFDLTNTARSVFNDRVFEYIRFVFCDNWSRLMENPDLYYILC